VVFEFDSDLVPSVGVGHVRVDLSTPLMTASQVGTALVSAIAGAPALQVTAAKAMVQPFVTLTHDVPGVTGNRPVLEAVANSGFAVSGLSGGTGKDCANGAGCATAADCVGSTCTGTPRVCGP